jgi:flagellin-like hook-associated protein FlgL
MPSTFDPLLRLELQATGENATTWGIKTNNNLDLVAAAIAGIAIVSVSAGDVTLSTANAVTDQARAAILLVQGTLTADAGVVVPAASKIYVVLRQTTGNFNVILKNTGTGAALPASGSDIIVCTTATCVGLLGSLDTRIEAVSAAVSALGIQVAEVSASVSALNVQVAAVSAQVSALNALDIRIIE